MGSNEPTKPRDDKGDDKTENIIDFRGHVAKEASSAEEKARQEKARRFAAEAERLTRLSPPERRFWLKGSAEDLGVAPEILQAAVDDILKAREKAEKEAEKATQAKEKAAAKAAEKQELKAEKEAEAKRRDKLKTYQAIRKLPPAEREARLRELAHRVGEDLEAVRAEFAAIVGPEVPTDPSREPWPESVTTASLLLAVIAQLARYVVLSNEAAIAIGLWVLMSWVHDDIATHSPILALTSAEAASGKTTTINVIGYMVPRPYHAVEATGPSLYHLIERLRPTVMLDEADRLLRRKNDLMHVINAGWTRGAKVPRFVSGGLQEYDLFCPKVIGMLGLDLPPTTVGRSIIIRLVPKLPEEMVENFKYTDDDTFVTLRRKALRWANDNVAALKDADPTMPFGGRLGENWRLLFAIAELAGSTFATRTRKAALKLSRKTAERSEGVRLLEALRSMFTDCEAITSADIVQRLTADPDAEWCEFRGRSPITQRQVAALLSAYDIRPETLHPTKRSTVTRRGYRLAQFVDSFRRYLPDPHIRTQHRKP